MLTSADWSDNGNLRLTESAPRSAVICWGE